MDIGIIKSYINVPHCEEHLLDLIKFSLQKMEPNEKCQKVVVNFVNYLCRYI